jgi:uncharacterized protein (DUF885 family)
VMGTDGNAQAVALSDRYWEQLLELEPMIGTSIGDERYDDALPDPSEAGRDKSAAIHRGALSDLASVDRGDLGAPTRVTLDILEAIAKRFLDDIDLRADRLSVANHLWGPSQTLIEIASIQRTDSPERLDRYEARLRAIPDFLKAWADVGTEAIATSVTSPAVVAERTVAQLERMLSIPADSSPAMMPLGEDGEAKSRIADVVRDVVNPAFQAYLDSVRDYLPHATESIGVSALPGGDELYAAAIQAWTTLPIPSQELHDLGNQRFDAIMEERRQLCDRLGYSSAAETIQALEASGDDLFATKEDLVAYAESQVSRSWDAAPNFFGRLPRAKCQVRAIEEFREADMPGAFYNPATVDGSRPGVYYVNTYDLPSRGKHHLAAISYHEANPGHHFQISISQGLAEVPTLMRLGGFLAGSAFSEGWGLYCERLADEMGLYLNDWERLGMLEAQALRAGRLITDTGIHALGWTRDQAIAKLEESGSPHTDAVIEIDRYIAMPGQALSYMTGMVEIENARSAAANRDGAAFSLKDFHDKLLGLGEPPLGSLRREMA